MCAALGGALAAAVPSGVQPLLDLLINARGFAESVVRRSNNLRGGILPAPRSEMSERQLRSRRRSGKVAALRQGYVLVALPHHHCDLLRAHRPVLVVLEDSDAKHVFAKVQ